jgi:hypothetical protein
LKVVPGTECSQKIFQKFFRPKNKVFGPVQIPKKNFFEFFSSISRGLSTGTKGEKVVTFGLSTGTKSEKLNFILFKYSEFIFSTGTKSEKYHFSVFVPVLNPIITTFSPLVPVQSPQDIEEKNTKKVFFGYLYQSKYRIFGPKKVLKNFLAAFGTW